MTDPESASELAELLKLYPDELLASQVEYPQAYLEKWDAGTRTRHLTGVAANDCHHNQVLIVKMVDADTVLLGTIVDRDDSMQTFKAACVLRSANSPRATSPGTFSCGWISTRTSGPSATSARMSGCRRFSEPALRSALKQGYAYVSHDWMCDATGFAFETDGGRVGDEVAWRPGLQFRARFPVPCRIRLMTGGETVASATALIWTHW